VSHEFIRANDTRWREMLKSKGKLAEKPSENIFKKPVDESEF